MKYNQQLIDYVLLLRFGTISLSDTLALILNYKTISAMIKKPLSTVISLVKAGLHAAKYGYSERPPNKIKLK